MTTPIRPPSDLPAAAVVYLAAVAIAAVQLAVVLFVDLILWAEGQATMTAWLRRHPVAWALPVLALCLSVMLLSWHIFRR